MAARARDGAEDRIGDEVRIYTDGGAKPNPGPGGWGAVLLRPAAGKPRIEELSGGERHTTNNRMELTAAIRGLEAVAEGTPARLVTDSQYLRRGITRWLPGWVAAGWRRKDGGEVANQDLWHRLAEVAGARRVRWEWVKGHRGHRWNERADALARAAGEAVAGRRSGARTAVPEAAAAGPADFDLYLKASGRGGWAARVRARGGEAVDDDEAGELLTGARRGASANELILLAAAAALESLPPGAAAAVHTGSDYLRDGAVQWLPLWRRRGWKTRTGGAVANRAAWQRLARALEGRPVAWPRPGDEAAAEIAVLEKPARRAAG